MAGFSLVKTASRSTRWRRKGRAAGRPSSKLAIGPPSTRRRWPSSSWCGWAARPPTDAQSSRSAPAAGVASGPPAHSPHGSRPRGGASARVTFANARRSPPTTPAPAAGESTRWAMSGRRSRRRRRRARERSPSNGRERSRGADNARPGRRQDIVCNTPGRRWHGCAHTTDATGPRLRQRRRDR